MRSSNFLTSKSRNISKAADQAIYSIAVARSMYILILLFLTFWTKCFEHNKTVKMSITIQYIIYISVKIQ